MKILINKLHFPVEVLGPGRRVGIWMQGCTIRCFGCISRDTWPADPRYGVDVGDVLSWVAGLQPGQVDGITISGGEPFEQPDALQFMLEGLHSWRSGSDREIDILAYSGHALSELQSSHAPILEMLDAVVPEPFKHGAPTDLPLRGSANQHVVALSRLGRARYTGEALSQLVEQRHRVQLEVDDESIWMIGIPEQGAMRRVQDQAARLGIEMRRPSWLI